MPRSSRFGTALEQARSTEAAGFNDAKNAHQLAGVAHGDVVEAARRIMDAAGQARSVGRAIVAGTAGDFPRANADFFASAAVTLEKAAKMLSQADKKREEAEKLLSAGLRSMKR